VQSALSVVVSDANARLLHLHLHLHATYLTAAATAVGRMEGPSSLHLSAAAPPRIYPPTHPPSIRSIGIAPFFILSDRVDMLPTKEEEEKEEEQPTTAAAPPTASSSLSLSLSLSLLLLRSIWPPVARSVGRTATTAAAIYYRAS
jgi:hypothetical protein